MNRELTIAPVEGDARMAAWARLALTRQLGGAKTAELAITPRDRATLIRAVTDARTSLREAALAAAEAAARARSVVEALDEALASLREGDTAPASAPPALPAWTERSRQVDLLSPREREVLALVAAGHSNKSIAEALFVSPNTIKTHVASLLNKLHAGTRVELAAIATRQQVL